VMYGVVRDGMTSRSGIIPTFYDTCFNVSGKRC
jgi:hypothetical protein